MLGQELSEPSENEILVPFESTSFGSFQVQYVSCSLLPASIGQ